MSEKPLVSTIIPTYDRPDMLARAVQSVDTQSYDNVEVIVVDGPSEVSAKSVLRGMDIDITCRCIQNETLKGLPTARNDGIDLAQGKYICFLDDDDTWEREKLQKQVDRITDSDFGAVYCGVNQITDGGTQIASKRESKEGNITSHLILRNFIGTLSCFMIQTDVIEEVSGFDEEMKVWEDWDLYIRVAKNWHIGAVPETAINRHHHSEQTSGNITSREEVSQYFFNKHRHIAKDHEGFTERRFESRIEFNLVRTSYRNDDFDRARRHLTNAITLYPYELIFYIYLVLLAGGKYTFYPPLWIKRHLM